MVQLGFALPQFGPLARNAAEVGRFAAEAEKLGARSLWVGDRLLCPVSFTVGYGGTDTIPAEFRSVLDPFALLTVAATATREAVLGTNVLNLPWYAPAVIARSLTTIDVLSGGRLVPGFGIGWSPEEYAAAGVPWQRRGRRLDETLDALETWWTENPAGYEGELVTLPQTYVDVRPVRRPPIYLGAMTERALHRVGRRADGWLPAWVIPGPDSVDPLLRMWDVVRAAASAAGRPDPAVVLRVNAAAGTSPERMIDVIGWLAERTGFTDIFLDPMYVSSSVDDALGLAERLLAAV